MADLFACGDVDVECISGQGSVSQAMTSTLALGVVYDSLNSQVALGDANVHVDAVVLYNEPVYIAYKHLCLDNMRHLVHIQLTASSFCFSLHLG